MKDKGLPLLSRNAYDNNVFEEEVCGYATEQGKSVTSSSMTYPPSKLLVVIMRLTYENLKCLLWTADTRSKHDEQKLTLQPHHIEHSHKTFRPPKITTAFTAN